MLKEVLCGFVLIAASVTDIRKRQFPIYFQALLCLNRHALAIDGIKYVKLDGKEYYAQEIFDSSELVANLDKNAVAVDHSVYDHII